MKNDVKKALSLIHKGLTTHPCSRELYIQAIELELLTVEKDDWPTDPMKTQKQSEICYKKIETYVETMFQNINNYSCLVSVLGTLDSHAFTINIRNKIVNKLMTQYCNEEQVWQILAEREREGHHYPQVEETQTSTKFRLKRCLEKFEEGLAQICPRKKGAMWALYLDYLIELNRQNTVGNSFIRNTLLQKLTEARNLSLLTEKYYVIWANLLTEEEEIIKVVEDGLQALPLSVDLWKLKLRCMVMKDDISEMNKEFKKGYLALKEKSGPLWTMILRYHQLSSPNHIIETIFRDGVTQKSKEIANLVKPDYIEWVAINKDIDCARDVYKNLARSPPFCKDLHAKMFKLEVNELNIDVKALETPMKLACEQFGHEDADVWINLRDIYFQYLNLFQEVDPLFNINDKIREIRKQAEEALKNNPIMWEDFKDKYDTPVNMDWKK